MKLRPKFYNPMHEHNLPNLPPMEDKHVDAFIVVRNKDLSKLRAFIESEFECAVQGDKLAVQVIEYVYEYGLSKIVREGELVAILGEIVEDEPVAAPASSTADESGPVAEVPHD